MPVMPPTDSIMLDTVGVDTVSVGVEPDPGSVVTLRNSSIHALQAVQGTLTLAGSNDRSLPPLNLLGAIGLPLIVLAVAAWRVSACCATRGAGARRRPLATGHRRATGMNAPPCRTGPPVASDPVARDASDPVDASDRVDA